MDRRKARMSPKEWTLLAVCMILLTALLALLLFISLRGVGPYCPDGSYVPVVNMHTSPIPEGYEIEIGGVSMVVPLGHYKVSVLKDGRLWTGFPETLTDTTANFTYGRGPAGEWLNFSDSDGNFGLSHSDRFTLEDLESGSEYEIVLLWAENNKRIADEIVEMP